jgi:hypothetical protein
MAAIVLIRSKEIFMSHLKLQLFYKDLINLLNFDILFVRKLISKLHGHGCH